MKQVVEVVSAAEKAKCPKHKKICVTHWK